MQVEGVSNIQSVLRSELLRRTKSDPKYSLRVFAKHLGVSPATLSGVMTGKRFLSRKKAGTIVDQLNLNPIQSSAVLDKTSFKKGTIPSATQFQTRKNSKDTAETVEMRQLALDTFQAISDWYHWAIREMPALHRKRFDARSIAKELGCSYVEAQDSLDRLVRLGLLAEKNGKLVATERHISSGTDFPSAAMRRFHMQLLQKAKQSLLTDNVSERDFSAIFMAIDSSKLPEAKKRIKNFRRELCEFLEEGKPDRLYTMTLNLFPLSREAKG